MKEPIMTEKESMELIASMINKAKNNFSENGLLYLIWGWVILICCIINFVGDYFLRYPNSYRIWLVADILVILQVFYLRRKFKMSKVRTYTGEINGYVWLVFVVSIILMVFICIKMKYFSLINPLLLVLYGVPTFLSGVIMKFRPLVIGAICCWLLAIISPFITAQFSVLLIAAAIIVGWLVPGYLLKQKFRISN
jgi:hypothetical protein